MTNPINYTGGVPQPAATSNNMAAFTANPELQALIASDSTTTAFGSDSAPRVSIKSRVFRLIQDGSEVAINPNPMSFIVVSAAPAVSRSFYGSGFVEGTKERPLCSSTDGKVPNANSTNPQATACAMCPQNREGTGQNGQGRACRFFQNIAVVLPHDFSVVYAMRIPAASLFGGDGKTKFGLQQYTRFLRAKGCSIAMVETMFNWDLTAPGVVMHFTPVRSLTRQEYEAIVQLQKDPKTLLALNINDSFDPEAPALAGPSVPPVAAPAPAQTYTAPPPTTPYPAPTAPVVPGYTPPANHVQPPVNYVPPVVQPPATPQQPQQAAPYIPQPTIASMAPPAPVVPGAMPNGPDLAELIDKWSSDDGN